MYAQKQQKGKGPGGPKKRMTKNIRNNTCGVLTAYPKVDVGRFGGGLLRQAHPRHAALSEHGPGLLLADVHHGGQRRGPVALLGVLVAGLVDADGGRFPRGEGQGNARGPQEGGGEGVAN